MNDQQSVLPKPWSNIRRPKFDLYLGAVKRLTRLNRFGHQITSQDVLAAIEAKTELKAWERDNPAEVERWLNPTHEGNCSYRDVLDAMSIEQVARISTWLALRPIAENTEALEALRAFYYWAFTTGYSVAARERAWLTRLNEEESE